MEGENNNSVDITIWGQPVIDHVIHWNNPFRYGQLKNICRLEDESKIVFKHDSYIETYQGNKSYYFGPMDKKYNISLKYTVDVPKAIQVQPEKIASLGWPIVNLGGGGPNVLQTLYKIFRIVVQLIGAYSKKIEPAIESVLKEETKGNFELVPLYDNPPINIVIEGLGKKAERTIFRSPFAPKFLDKKYSARGKAVMVNTVYNGSLAMTAFYEATRPGKLGVVALTESLCNDKEQFTQKEKDFIKQLYGKEVENINTIYDFVIKELIPNLVPSVIIINESELNHLVKDKIKAVDNGYVYFDTLLTGIRELRKKQIASSKKSRIYVTMGASGSLCLDEEDILHYCGITVEEDMLPKGKNAIGDVYAAMILACEYFSKYKKLIPASYIIAAAAAAADALIYTGFEELSVVAVNKYMMESFKHYHDLGKLEIDIEGKKNEQESLDINNPIHKRIDEIDQAEWLKKINPKGRVLCGHLILGDIIEEVYLTEARVREELRRVSLAQQSSAALELRDYSDPAYVIEKEEEVYQRKKQIWDEEYKGKFIAIHDGNVMASSENEDDLTDEIIIMQRSEGKLFRAYIRKVGEELPFITIPRPRGIYNQKE